MAIGTPAPDHRRRDRGAVLADGVSRAYGWRLGGTAQPLACCFSSQPCPVAIVGIAVCVVVTRTLRVRTAVDRLAARLSGPVAALSGVQGVHFAVPGEARWVDVAGRDATDLPGQDRYVVLSDESGPVLRLLVARGTDQGDLLAALTPATRLALQNAQLSAVAKARLADVQASQRRVVATSDSERRRIERDLHDGAQQRLVSVAFHLKVALASADPSTSVRLAAAEGQVRNALGQLRRLAHGIFPSVLADEGLAAALDELIAASDVPTTLDVRTRDDVGMETAMAAYATVAAVLNSIEHPAPDTRAVILVDRDGDTLTVSAEVQALSERSWQQTSLMLPTASVRSADGSPRRKLQPERQ